MLRPVCCTCSLLDLAPRRAVPHRYCHRLAPSFFSPVQNLAGLPRGERTCRYVAFEEKGSERIYCCRFWHGGFEGSSPMENEAVPCELCVL